MAQLEHQFRIAEIDVARNAIDDKIVGMFRFDTTPSQRQSPLLLILVEIHSTLYAYERLLDVINATAEQARYLVSGVDQDPIGRFEKLIQRVNEAVAAFCASEATPLNWNRVHIYLMEFSKGHLCLSGTGTLTNLFLQKQEDGTYRSFDLFGSLERPVETDPTKPFSSLICGDMNPGDLLMIGSSNLDRLRSELRLRERLTSLPSVTAALEIRQDLEKRSIPDHFFGAIISCHEFKLPLQERTIPSSLLEKDIHSLPQSTASVEKLRESEEEVEGHLAPVLSPIAPLATQARISERLEKIKSFLQKRWWPRIRQSVRRSSKPDPMAMASLRGMNAGYGNVLTAKRKLLFIGIVGSVLLVSILGVSIRSYRASKAEATAWNRTYDQLMDFRNRAESDLIYGNEERAKQEVNNATELLDSLSATTEERKQQMEKARTELVQLQNRLRRFMPITGVTELFSLPSAASSQRLHAPVLSKNTAYVASPDGIVAISLSTKEIKTIPLPQETGTISSSSDGTTMVLFATEEGKLVGLQKNNQTLSVLPWSHTKSSSTSQIVLYASRLYSLDPAQHQIWRSPASGSGFGPESAYLKAAQTSLQDAISMAIDSNVYVLKRDGTLVRFLSGAQDGFALAPIDPPLRSPGVLWTDLNATHLYLTDPDQKRILIFEKSGVLTAQLTSPEFRNPTGISVDEANKRLIVTDDHRLLLVPIP